MHRPALSLAQGLLYTALILLALFIIGGILTTTTKTDDAMEEGDGTSSAAMERQDGASAVTCGKKNADCESSDDCCGNMGLECQQVRTTSGGFDWRCMPVEVMICKSECEGSVWGKQKGCKKAVAPLDMPRCQDFVGTECKTSVHEARNSRECTDT